MRPNPAFAAVRRLTIVVAFGGMVGACANPFAGDAPTLDEVLNMGWLNADDDAAPVAVAPLPLYCYGTIGREDCHAEPLPEDGSRLVGYQGPPPPVRDEL